MIMRSPSHRAHDPERPHPLERLSRTEQLRWAAERRKTRRALDALHLRTLRAAAAGQATVSSLSSWDPGLSSWDPGLLSWDPGLLSWDPGSSWDPDHPGDSGRPGRPGPVRAVELEVGERLVVGRVSAEAEASLSEAIRSGPVRLVGAGRYGPFWTLNFQAARQLLIVLADRVALRPGAGGPPGRHGAPVLRAGL